MAAAAPRPGWIAPVPNLLTGLRIALAVAFPLLPEAAWPAAVVAAGGSDLLDGWIARRFHAESPLGRVLDGIADKAFVLAAVGTLAWAGRLPPWQGAVVMARDVTVAGIAAGCAARRAWEAFRHMRPRAAGKATTALAFLWFLALLVPGAAAARLPLFLLAGAASVAAAVDYAAEYRRQRARNPGPEHPPA